jgi:hypothetical protein
MKMKVKEMKMQVKEMKIYVIEMISQTFINIDKLKAMPSIYQWKKNENKNTKAY